MNCILYTFPLKGQDSLPKSGSFRNCRCVKARPAPSWKDQVLRARKDLSFSSSLLQDQLEYSHLFVWAVIFPRAQLQRGPLRSSGSLVQSSGIAPVASSSSLEDDDASSKATQGGKVPTGYSQLGSGATFSYFQVSLLAILWNSAFRCLYLSFSPLLLTSLLFTAIGTQRHPGKFPTVPGRRRGKRGFPAAPRQRPRESFFNASRGPSPLP